MDAYGIALLVCLAAVGAALGLAALSRCRRSRRTIATATAAGGLAFLLVVATGLTHLLAGHRPGSATPLGPLGFLAEHAVLPALAAGAVVAVMIARAGSTDV